MDEYYNHYLSAQQDQYDQFNEVVDLIRSVEKSMIDYEQLVQNKRNLMTQFHNDYEEQNGMITYISRQLFWLKWAHILNQVLTWNGLVVIGCIA